jgi:hypothetical protein
VGDRKNRHMETITPATVESAPVTPAIETPAKPTMEAGRFNGTFKTWQQEAFGDLRRAGLSMEVAHKVAQDFGSDMGRLISTDASAKAKVGKANGDGLAAFSASLKGKVTTSRSMSTIRVCQQIAALYKEGLLETRIAPPLSKILAEYQTECAEWATGFNWK